MSFKKDPFLIIGGTTKAGTTSLYEYLGDHPEIGKSSMKETRFFLNNHYPLNSKYRLKDGLDKYQNYFLNAQPGQLKLEATPDYLYSKDTATDIKSNLNQAKMLFILRDPISRLISWFNFAKQIGKLPQEVDLDEYVKIQKQGSQNEQFLMALEQGKYSNYLETYYQLFGKENIYVAFYEHLSTDIRALMKDICQFFNIDPAFYNTYDFQKFNQTVGVKNQSLHKAYIQQSFKIRKLVHDKKMIHQTLKNIKKVIHPIYVVLNGKNVKSVQLSNELKRELSKYYGYEYHYFHANFSNVPWQNV